MDKRIIRVAVTLDGAIEAAYGLSVQTKRLTINRQTGQVISTNVPEGTDDFRRLVRAAREWKST